MRRQSNTIKIETVTIFAIFIIATSISPWWTADPFNFPKSLLLTIFTLILFALHLNYKIIKSLFKDTPGLKFTLFFPMMLLIIFILNSTNKYQQLFGYYGRRMGFLSLLCYYIIFIVIIKLSSKNLVHLFSNIFTTAGVTYVLYSVLQVAGLIQINTLTSKNLQPFGFFGNINFQSFFLGLATVYSLSISVNFHSNKVRFIAQKIIVPIILIYGIWITKSEQGFIVIALSLSFVLLILLLKNRHYSLFILVTVIFTILSSIFLLGVFNKGPLSDLIFQDSLKARGYYWQAGLRMAADNPFLGVGIDSYGDFWAKYRSLESVQFLGPNDFSTSSHNFFIDIAANCGFITLFSFILLNLIIFYCGAQKIFNGHEVDIIVIFLFSGWIGFQVHHLLSVSNIGINIWFWVLSGLLIGYKQEKNYVVSIQKLKIEFTFIKILLSIIFGILIQSQQISEVSKLKIIFVDNQLTHLENLSKQNFITSQGLLTVASTYLKLENISESLNVNRILVQKYPNFYPGWQLLYSNPSATLIEKSQALTRIQNLNPTFIG